MIEQETIESVKEAPEESKELPCIYGSEIRAVCLIREEAKRNTQQDISKWVKGPSMRLSNEELQGLSELLSSVMKGLTSINLDRFCDHCPWRELYLKGH